MIRRSILAALCAAAAPALVAAQDVAGAVRLGDLVVAGAYARANPTPNGASAAYFTVETSGAADRLVGAASPAARRVELHTHLLDEQGVARMRQVDAVPVAPDAPAVLAPGGYHVMLMGLESPLEPGQSIELTLTFETAGQVTLVAPVRAIGAQRAGEDAGHGAAHGADHGHGVGGGMGEGAGHSGHGAPGN